MLNSISITVRDHLAWSHVVNYLLHPYILPSFTNLPRGSWLKFFPRCRNAKWYCFCRRCCIQRNLLTSQPPQRVPLFRNDRCGTTPRHAVALRSAAQYPSRPSEPRLCIPHSKSNSDSQPPTQKASTRGWSCFPLPFFIRSFVGRVGSLVKVNWIEIYSLYTCNKR